MDGGPLAATVVDTVVPDMEETDDVLEFLSPELRPDRPESTMIPERNFLLEAEDDQLFSPLVLPAMAPEYADTDHSIEHFPALDLPGAQTHHFQQCRQDVGVGGGAVQRPARRTAHKRVRSGSKAIDAAATTATTPTSIMTAATATTAAATTVPVHPAQFIMTPAVALMSTGGQGGVHTSCGVPMLPMSPTLAFSTMGNGIDVLAAITRPLPPLPLPPGTNVRLSSPAASPLVQPMSSPASRARRTNAHSQPKVGDPSTSSPTISPALQDQKPLPIFASPGNASMDKASPALRPNVGSYLKHASPQLYPALKSPSLQPVVKSDRETRVLTPQEAEQLARNSNYQTLLNGDTGVLGVPDKSDFTLSVGQRRKTHKTAEQKRRDHLKAGYDLLRGALPNPSEAANISKAELLRQCYDHMTFLEKKVSEYEKQLHENNIIPVAVEFDPPQLQGVSVPASPSMSPAKQGETKTTKEWDDASEED